MSNRGNALVLATVLYGRDKSKTVESIADNIYHAVEACGFGTDERKADLYAQLTEKLRTYMAFALVVDIIEACMNNTDRGVY
jgi:hypothetical protein